jgi:hypothetical protein
LDESRAQKLNTGGMENGAGSDFNRVGLAAWQETTLKKVVEKIDKISVFGGLEGVLKNLVKIRP